MTSVSCMNLRYASFVRWQPLVAVAIITAAKEEVRQSSIWRDKVCTRRKIFMELILSCVKSKIKGKLIILLSNVVN